MEQLINVRSKTSIEKENIDECYLNPKDAIINERYTQLLFKTLPKSLLFYLKLNEILIIILEEKFVIYDIKKSLAKNLSIIDEVFYKDITEYNCKNKNNLNESLNSSSYSKKKDRNKILNFKELNFYAKENEDKIIKNILISDDFYSNKGTFLIFIELLNLDIFIVLYNLLTEINKKPKFKLINKYNKNFFINKENNNILEKDNYYKNSFRTKFKVINNNKIYFVYRQNSIFFIFEYKKNFQNYKKFYIKDEEFVFFDIKNKIDDYFEIITSGIDNELYFYLFNLDNSKSIIKQKIIINNYDNNYCNYGNISQLKFYENKNYFFAIKLNHIYIIHYNIEFNENIKLNIKYIQILNIEEFNEESIYDIFLLQEKYLYIFTHKNKYLIYNYNINLTPKEEEKIIYTSVIEKPLYFKITKFIYDIKSFVSENGFFILVTQSPIKPINMNIIYKLNYKHLSKINDNLAESLICSLRTNEINTISENQKLVKKLNYYYNKIFKGQTILVNNEKNNFTKDDSNEEEEINNILMADNNEKNEKEVFIKNEQIKKDLINFYVKNKEEYKKYLKNEIYKCEFCNKIFVEYDVEKRVYKCENGDINFSCCISARPIEEDFLWCCNCDLFFSKIENILYCIVCDNMLSNLDSI